MKKVEVAGVLIHNNGRYLLVQEKQPKAYRLWNLPAGHVDNDETFLQAAIREAKEETGLEVVVAEDAIEIFTTGNNYVTIHIFKAAGFNGEIKINEDETLDVGWFTPDEIQKLKLRDDSFKVLFK